MEGKRNRKREVADLNQVAVDILDMIVSPSPHDAEYLHAMVGPEACPRCVGVEFARRFLALVTRPSSPGKPASKKRRVRR